MTKVYPRAARSRRGDLLGEVGLSLRGDLLGVVGLRITLVDSVNTTAGRTGSGIQTQCQEPLVSGATPGGGPCGCWGRCANATAEALSKLLFTALSASNWLCLSRYGPTFHKLRDGRSPTQVQGVADELGSPYRDHHPSSSSDDRGTLACQPSNRAMARGLQGKAICLEIEVEHNEKKLKEGSRYIPQVSSPVGMQPPMADN